MSEKPAVDDIHCAGCLVKERRIAQLTDENEALKEARDVEWRKFVATTKNEQIATLKQKWEDAVAENEALRKYVQHHYQCDSHNEPPIYPCTCGLEALLKGEENKDV